MLPKHQTCYIINMTVVIPKKIEKDLKIASRRLGLSKEDFLTNAVLYYLQVMKKKMELKKELNIWEKVSAADFTEFERKI